MQHIKTKYVGPTSDRPARITGITSERMGRVTQSRSMGLSTRQQHAEVARAVVNRMRISNPHWAGTLVGDEIDADTMIWFFEQSVTRIKP